MRRTRKRDRWLAIAGVTSLVVLAAVDACGGEQDGRGPGQSPLLPDAGGPCPAVYVAPHGTDENDGCSPATPKFVLERAIYKAENLILNEHRSVEVRVCEGEYPAGRYLTVRTPRLLVQGGYDCSFLSEPSPSRATVLRARSTMQIEAVEGTTFVGLTFRGGVPGEIETAVEYRGPTVVIENGAPLFRGNYFFGPRATGPSMALRIDGGEPELVDNVIVGGETDARDMAPFSSQRLGSAGSVGLLIAGARPRLRANRIEGGGGLAGSIGLVYVNGGDDPLLVIQGNVLRGGSATGGVGSVAVVLEGPADLIDNTIEAGMGAASTASDFASIGVAVHGSRRAFVRRNRILSGNGPGKTAAVFVSGYSPKCYLDNNFIAGSGSPSPTTEAFIFVSERPPPSFSSTPFLAIRNNTILAPVVTAGGRGVVFHLEGSGRAVVQNNLVVARSAEGTMLALPSCPAPTAFAHFENNFFVSPSKLVEGGCNTMTTIDSLEAALRQGSDAGVERNYRLAETCGSDTGCIARTECATGTDCARAVFTEWTDGVGEIGDGGLLLKGGAPCAVVEGGRDLRGVSDPDAGPGVDHDYFYRPRTLGFSRGAHELDDAGCSP